MIESKTKKRIGVLRGGAGEHYTPSLKRGGEIISYISENLSDKYNVVDILIDKDYIWHVNGLPVNPSDLIHKVNIVWNATHPSFSNILDSLSISSVSSRSFPLNIFNNPSMLKEHVKKIGLSMPRYVLFPAYQEDFDGLREKYAIKKAKEVFEKFGAPWTIKSFTSDSGMGIHLAKTFNELVAGIEDGVKHGKSILVEEFITGKVASVHSVPGFRNEDIYTFPLGNSFGIFSAEEKEKLASVSKDLHKHIDAKHYLKSDFILTPRGKVYLLQIDLHPDLKSGSHFSQVCESVGTKMHNIVEHILENALNKA